jgi:hypothetical protein
MQFTGTSFVGLPQVNQFGFCITGINVQSNLANFQFLDIGGNSFAFNFNSGFVSTNKIICAYNFFGPNTIIGYISGGNLNYYINEIGNQQAISFGRLSGVCVNAGTGIVYCDFILNSNPINYTVSFAPYYNYGGQLTGTIVSDTAFQIINPSILSYSSNKALLNNTYTVMNVVSGTNNYVFQDLDTDGFEYQDNFYASLPVSFGDIGGQFYSWRSGINGSYFLSLSDQASNIYYQASAFNGIMSGNQFVYQDSPVEYYLNYTFNNVSYLGYQQNANLSVIFTPLNPVNNSGYQASYITGYSLVSGGMYGTPPSASFSQYFYVTGIQNSMQSFLFSSGCANSINVSFEGGNPISGASGVLILKPVYLSGIYGNGVNYFKIASGYSGMSNGWAYQTAPQFVLATGGGCFSLPDASGYQTAQFQYATGLGAIYRQAYGLTGLVLTTPSGGGLTITGLEMTNLGVGYNTGFIPYVYFNRGVGDTQTANATGNFYLKNSGVYNFTGFWDVSCNLGTGYVNLSGYNGYYSGNFPVYGNGNVNILINLSQLDNTSPVSGLLSLTLAGNGTSTTFQDVILQSRTFDLNTGALLPNAYPMVNFYPLNDLLQYLDNDPSYQAYLNSIGGNVSNIINF